MRIAVAMSGGVDSSVAALIMKDMGHEVVGITVKMLPHAEMEGSEPPSDGCGSPESLHDASLLAGRHGFPHTVLDLEGEFSREVIGPFCDEYLRGRTPSPCIHCNARIKFKKILELSRTLGCEKLATGHYARLGRTEGGRFYVRRGVDDDKDQSYFLFSLSQDLLGELLFPLGEHRKNEIREFAKKMGVQAAERPESQEICFIPDDDYPGFIERRTGAVPPPGDIMDRKGRALGRHSGIHRYTIGQRRGLGISSDRPLYVLEIDAERNVVIVGRREDLLQKGLVADHLSYMKAASLDGLEVLIKTRSTQAPFQGRLEECGGEVHARFGEPQPGISPGQAAVFYDREGCILGGGWISRGL